MPSWWQSPSNMIMGGSGVCLQFHLGLLSVGPRAADDGCCETTQHKSAIVAGKQTQRLLSEPYRETEYKGKRNGSCGLDRIWKREEEGKRNVAESGCPGAKRKRGRKRGGKLQEARKPEQKKKERCFKLASWSGPCPKADITMA